MEKSFTASLDHLYEMLYFIRKQAIDAGFHEMSLIKIELASEEALVNIISYGYPEHHHSDTINITCEVSASQAFKITLVDSGIEYNPLNSPKKFDPHAPLEARIIGGYGIYFILKIMERVDYKRVNNQNILTMWKNFEGEPD